MNFLYSRENIHDSLILHQLWTDIEEKCLGMVARHGRNNVGGMDIEW